MTVDGVRTAIKPGEYEGNIVLTVTKEIELASTSGLGGGAPGGGGEVMQGGRGDAPGGTGGVPDSPGSGAPSDAGGGMLGFGQSGVSKPFKAAIYVDNGKYIMDKSVAAVVTGGEVTDTSTKDVKITSNEPYFNGIKEDISMSVPWVMGFSGNVRATNLGESGTVYYNNTHIKAQGWGCLSTDGVVNSRLYATKCLIETIESGYGAFSLGNNISTFSGCLFNVTSYDNATFKNITLNGDIINGDTALAGLSVTFENATITGAITTAVNTHAVGPNGEEVNIDHPELYKLISEVTNTFCHTNEKFGLKVSLDKKSKWIIDETSYLTELIINKDGAITTPEGYSVTMMVDGAAKAIKAGTYKGNIMIIVNKS